MNGMFISGGMGFCLVRLFFEGVEGGGGGGGEGL